MSGLLYDTPDYLVGVVLEFADEEVPKPDTVTANKFVLDLIRESKNFEAE